MGSCLSKPKSAPTTSGPGRKLGGASTTTPASRPVARQQRPTTQNSSTRSAFSGEGRKLSPDSTDLPGDSIDPREAAAIAAEVCFKYNENLVTES